MAEQAVREMLKAAEAGQPVDKDKLASSLMTLSNKYMAAYGSDASSRWLRYAYLTWSCSADEIQAFRNRVAGEAWRKMIANDGDPLVNVLLGLARPEEEAILKRNVAPRDPAAWEQIASVAPSNGPDYVHTHNLASITRMIFAVARDKENALALRAAAP
jgi:hypothetical protein